MLTAEWIPFGRPATDRLAELIDQAQANDPLAPVTVVTPSPGAAVVLRRRLGRTGLAAVSFVSMEQLAELLGARNLARSGRPTITPELVPAAVRVALRSHTGPLAKVADHRSTEERVAEVVLELAGVDAPTRSALPSRLPPLAAAVVEVAARTLELLADRSLDADLFEAAGERVRGEPSGTAALLGRVVLHLPRHLTPPARRLVMALADATPTVLLVGRTGVPAADEPAHQMLADLGTSATDPPDVALPVPSQVISADDVDDEVRVVLRSLMGLVDQGIPLHRMAVLHPSGEPYVRTISDQLRAAGIPALVPATDTLAQSVAGRTLLGVLAVVEGDLQRDDVISFLGQSPILGPDGRGAPVARWDHISRFAGVVRSHAAWQERLEAFAERRRNQADDLDRGDEPDPDRAERRRAEVAEAEALLATVHRLYRLGGQLPTTWAEVPGWGNELLDELLGPEQSWRGRPPEREVLAAEAVRAALEQLASLHALEPTPAPHVIRRTLEAALDVPAPRDRPATPGLLVAPISAGPGLDLDVVAVVGMTEGDVPRPQRDSVLFPESARQLAGLPPAPHGTAHQHRAVLAALAGAAHHRLLSWSRGDQRSGRSRIPSRWLIDLVEPLCHERPTAASLAASDGSDHDWLQVVPSFEGGLCRLDPPLDRADAELADLAVHAVAGADVGSHPLASHPSLAPALEMLAARRSESFTRFDGNLTHISRSFDSTAVHSPTALEAYATCPRQWFLSHLLGLGEPDKPDDTAEIEPSDLGTLAHAVLEEIVVEAIHDGTVPAPGDAWPDAVVASVPERVQRHLGDLAAKGRAGHPSLQPHKADEVSIWITAALRDDAAVRATTQATPVAAEHSFGRRGADPLEVELPSGHRLRLGGMIDRVDLSDERVHVYDYKTSKNHDAFKEISDDTPAPRGRKLQLGIYALAARAVFGRAVASAAYWFLKEPSPNRRLVRVTLGPAQEQAVLATLDRVVSGIDAGVFPARPGDYDWFTKRPDSCRYCDFHRLCSPDREEEWELAKADPVLADYRDLAEGPLMEAAPDGSGGADDAGARRA